MQNTSFDEDFGVNTVEGLTFNPVSNTLERITTIQGNNSLKLTYSGDNLTKIEKTVGDTTYTRTLIYDGSDHLTDITPWS